MVESNNYCTFALTTRGNMKRYKVTNVEFVNEDNVDEREVHATLENGTEVHICACQESFEQYNATRDELLSTLYIAEKVNGWLHGEDLDTEEFSY